MMAANHPRTLGADHGASLFVQLLVLLTACATACRPGTTDQTPREMAAPVVDEGLTSSHAWVRAETVRLLGLIEAPEFLPQLTRALDDESPLVQIAAIEAVLQLGDSSAEEAALGRLVSGEPEQRIQIMRLIIDSSERSFQQEVLRRSIRDMSPIVRRAALEYARTVGITLSVPELERLLEDEDHALVDEAFREFVRVDRHVALAFALRGIRSSNIRERHAAMSFARHLVLPELWPVMRSYAASDADPRAQELAFVVLGHLADPIAEDPLRTMVLAGGDEAAPRALYALSFIPTERAREQPLVHRLDSRPEVRAAAFDAMRQQGQPVAEFEVFLEDSDRELAQRALGHIQTTDPEFAAEAFARVLEEADGPSSVMWALYRTSLDHDISGMLVAGAGNLEELMRSEDRVIANLAVRLLLRSRSVAAFVTHAMNDGSGDELYAVIEATLTDDGNYSDLYARALEHDLAMVRIASAIGIWRLGNDYAPSPAQEPS